MSETQKILVVLTSHATKGSTGAPTGAYVAEISHPLAVFRDAGLAVDFASTRGGRVPLDGTDSKDPVDRAFLADEATLARVHASLAPASVAPERYAGVFYAGGHGTMWDFPEAGPLSAATARIWAQGGVVGAVCHGPAGLLPVRLADGTPLVRGREVAAFTNDEERAVGLAEVVPFLLADALVALGAKHRPAANWQRQVVVDGRLVTGQNPASARGVAEAMVAALRAPGGGHGPT